MMRGPPFASDRIPRIAYCDHGPAASKASPSGRGRGMTNRRQFLKLTLGLPLSSGALSLESDRLHAQEPWPTRTITIVVPFPPGGVADFAARPLAAYLSERFGRNVVIENKGGAGGGISYAYVARAEPGGNSQSPGMTPPGPILLFSIYRSDIPRFERLLVRALPDIPIHCASTPEEAAPYLDRTAILYGWGFPPQMLGKMPRLRWVQKIGAGVDEIIESWPFGRDVILTRTDGKLIAPRMAEYALAAILDQTLRL